MSAAMFYRDDRITLLHGHATDALATLTPGSVQTVVTSPPYFGLRDYGEPDQIGLEETPQEYVTALVEVFRAVRDALADDGTLWLNIGDTYSGYHGNARVGDGPAPSDKPGYRENMRASLPGKVPAKNLLGIPWRLALALQDDGWFLRSDIIWQKVRPVPEAVKDRPTRSHEHLFLLTKRPRYFYDAAAIAEPTSTDRPQLRRARDLAAAAGLTDEHLAAIRASGLSDTGKALTTTDGAGKNTARVQALAAEAKAVLGGYWREFLLAETRNARDVWTIPTEPFKGAHFATMPTALARRCVLAGSRPGDTVLDPFSGSGTTGLAACEAGRRYVGVDLSTDYLALSLRTRLAPFATPEQVAA